MKQFKTILLAAACLLTAARLWAARDDEPATRLDITSQPAGATVLVDHRERGTTPLALTDLAPGAHLLQLSRIGCQDHFESIVIEAGAPTLVERQLTPVNGLLLINTDPAGCDVSAKGVSLGLTPLLVTSLESGRHRLAITSPGYQTKEVEVELEGRVPQKLEVELLSDSGTIAVTSDPEGAEVLVNGIARGHSPCRVDRIPGGTVTLKLVAAGFQPDSREISLAAGEVQNINVQLKPLPGTLRVVALGDNGLPLEGARVYIDNEFKGETPYDMVNAEPRKYRVRLDRPGHEPIARDVTLEKGASITEEFRMARITGRLEIITAPSSATILIDGKKVGITTTHGQEGTAVSDPFASEDIVEGEHVVEVVRKGFAPQKRTVTVKRGETLPLQFRLVRQFIPNYEVVTGRSHYKGVLEFINEEGIRIETTPGISQTIPMKDVKRHGALRVEE